MLDNSLYWFVKVFKKSLTYLLTNPGQYFFGKSHKLFQVWYPCLWHRLLSPFHSIILISPEFQVGVSRSYVIDVHLGLLEVRTVLPAAIHILEHFLVGEESNDLKPFFLMVIHVLLFGWKMIMILVELNILDRITCMQRYIKTMSKVSIQSQSNSNLPFKNNNIIFEYICS